VVPALDYKALLQANAKEATPAQVLQAVGHLEAIVDRKNVTFLSKLLSKVKKLKDMPFEGSPTGHLSAVLLLREVLGAASQGRADEALQGCDALFEALALVDWHYVVQRAVQVVPVQLPAMVRLQLVDRAIAADHAAGNGSGGMSATLTDARRHLVSVISIMGRPLDEIDVAALDAAGVQGLSMTDRHLLQLAAHGVPLSSVAQVVHLVHGLGGNAQDSAVCDLYDRAVQQHLAAAMVGQGIEELRGCLRSVQGTEMALGGVITAVLKPSLETCFEHSATPWAVEEMADAFLQGRPV